jgi:hypothetical protein
MTIMDADLELSPADLPTLLPPLVNGDAAAVFGARQFPRDSAMSTDLFRAVPLEERGFGIEAEITARLLRARVPIRHVRVGYEPGARKAGKKLTMLDGFRVLRTLVRCRFDGAAVADAGTVPSPLPVPAHAKSSDTR